MRVAETMTQADVTPDYLTLATLLQLFRKLGYIDGAGGKGQAQPHEGDGTLTSVVRTIVTHSRLQARTPWWRPWTSAGCDPTTTSLRAS